MADYLGPWGFGQIFAVDRQRRRSPETACGHEHERPPPPFEPETQTVCLEAAPSQPPPSTSRTTSPSTTRTASSSNNPPFAVSLVPSLLVSPLVLGDGLIGVVQRARYVGSGRAERFRPRCAAWGSGSKSSSACGCSGRGSLSLHNSYSPLYQFPAI